MTKQKTKKRNVVLLLALLSLFSAVFAGACDFIIPNTNDEQWRPVEGIITVNTSVAGGGANCTFRADGTALSTVANTSASQVQFTYTWTEAPSFDSSLTFNATCTNFSNVGETCQVTGIEVKDFKIGDLADVTGDVIGTAGVGARDNMTLLVTLFALMALGAVYLFFKSG